MPFNGEQFIPETFDDLIIFLVQGTNETLGTNYDFNSIQGTNIWKIFYPLLQKCIQQQTEFAQIYEKYKEYIDVIKDKVLIPKNNYIGIITNFRDLLKVNASIEPIETATAGQIKLCIDQQNPVTGNNADIPSNTDIGNFLSKYTAAGIYFPKEEGYIEYLKVLPNGAGEYAYRWVLPTEIKIDVNVAYRVSRNNVLPIPDTETIKRAFIDKFKAMYMLGQDFEPERFWNAVDMPFAADIDVTYSLTRDGQEPTAFISDIFESEYNEKLILGDVEISLMVD